jgi:hypothetical protein
MDMGGGWTLRWETLDADAPLYKGTPEWHEPDDRLMRATEQAGRSVILVRCKERCGRVLAEVMNPREGLLFVAYVELDGEFRAPPIFVDELDKIVALYCPKHGWRDFDTGGLKKALERQKPKVLFT